MKIKICYLGGGSKQWARVFMNDLALAEDIEGEIALFDTDMEAAIRNQKIGEYINQSPSAISKWDYKVYDKIEDALTGARFVVISILPGTFKEMRSDVHAPEKYGIYQSVGDTTGPGGVLRAMRTVPIYEYFAKKIEECCKDAWVLNFTNPMSICLKTLYDTFPGIKAFGCCHEVFHTQDFLCCVLNEMTGIKRPNRTEIYTDCSGINHFTWITEAKYKNIDLLALLPEFMEKYYEEGYYESGTNDQYKRDSFAYANKVKMDMFKRYGVLGAAGDRHLVEFMNNRWYIENPDQVDYYRYALTTVDFREKQQAERIQESILMSEGKIPVEVKKSSEEAVELMKAILGLTVKVSNVNLPNEGQMIDFPLGSIVETNCVFSNDCVKPVVAKPLPVGPRNLVMRNLYNIEELFEGIKERNLDKIFSAFLNQPSCDGLTIDEGRALFKEMVLNTKDYLNEYFDLKGYFGE